MNYRNDRENSLRELLTSGDEACVGYLNAAFEDGDVHYLLIALRNIIEPQHGSLESFAQKFSINPKALQKLFAEENIDFLVVNKIIQTFGGSLAILGTPYVTEAESSPSELESHSTSCGTSGDASFRPMYAKSRHEFK